MQKIAPKYFNISIVGAGYVGMSLAALLSCEHNVKVLDIDPNKVDTINSGNSTVEDSKIKSYIDENKLKISATLDINDALSCADFIIIATPTDYNEEFNYFDTSSVDQIVTDALKINNTALIVIKSTLPVGHTSYLQDKHNTQKIIFSPEFLREGFALEDNLNPSRIIVGSNCDKSKVFSSILKKCAIKKNVKILHIESSEAECIKLFSNSYLAMRVSFFNELDSYAHTKKLNTKNIIDGVCLDERIGEGYNNPSFGYGGYCLPKDTKQLRANYKHVPQNLIDAIVSSNITRKKYISKQILMEKPSVVGIYRLVMKKGSSNFRSSATLDIIKMINKDVAKIIIYEPLIDSKSFEGFELINDLQEFKDTSELVVTNRIDLEIKDIAKKCFTRDLFGIN